MYSPAEIKTWLRRWLLAYRWADFSREEHLAIVERAFARVQPYIDSPDETVRLTARSVGQYMAQSSLRPAKSRIVTELMACALLPLGFLRWSLQGLMAKPARHPKTAGVYWNQESFRFYRNPEIYHVPPELAADRPQTVFVKARYLRRDDFKFLGEVIRAAWPMLPGYKLQWIFKIAKEIAFARPLIDAHPSAYALMHTEFNCGASLLTLFAHRHGQKLYNIQHGDIFVWATNAFFETDRCYCWDEFYVGVLKQLRTRSDFRVYTNPAFVLSEAEKTVRPEGIGVFMPVVLTIPADQDKKDFAEALNALAQARTVSLRPHPGHINECDAILPLLSPKVRVTDPRTETSKQFLLRHEIIIGTISAAVIESIMLKREVVCFRSKYVNDIASYHFAYKKPNCHLCELSELAQAVETRLQAVTHQAASGA